MANTKYYVKKEFAENYGALLEDILSSAPICIKIFNEDLQLVFINSWGLEEHKIESQAQFDSFDYFSTIVELDQAKIKIAADAAFSGKVQYAEFEHVPGLSKQQWCFSVASPLKSSSGSVEYIIMCSLDFTEYTKAELSLKKEKRMFKLLLDATPLCIKWFDKTGGLISVNKAGQEEHFLTGKNEEEIKAWDYMGCIDEKYHAVVKEKLAGALANKESGEFLVKHTPGTSKGVWYRSKISPARNENGEVELVLFISQDITNEKKSENTEKQRIEELETMNKLMVGRELKMVELKKEIEKLKSELEKLKK